jgi:hypothetical protein
METHTLLVILIDFHSENNIYIPKIQKKVKKKTAIIVYAQTALYFATSLRNPICYDLSFILFFQLT